MAWDENISDGITAVRSSDFASAEKALKQALQFAKQNFSRTDSKLALTLSMLGHTYFRNEDFQRAEMLLEQSLRLHTSGMLIEPCLTMDTFALASIKIAVGKKVDACRLLEATLAMLHERGGTSPELEVAINEFEHQLYAVGRTLSDADIRELEGLAAEPVAVDTPSDGQVPALTPEEIESTPEPAAPAATMRDTTPNAPLDNESMCEVWEQQLKAGLQALCVEEDERETWVSGYLKLESALRVANKAFSANDERMVKTIKALAEASAKLHMFEQAESLYREAISRAKQAAGNDELVSVLRIHFALLYTRFNQLRQAKKILDSVKVPENLDELPFSEGLAADLEKASRQIAVYDSVQNMVRQAQGAEEQKDLDKAAKLTNTALSTLRQSFAPNHPETARVLRYRSQLLQQLGQEDQSNELAQRAERIERGHEEKASEWLRISEDLPKPDLGVPV